jgi:CRP-like cAMP-binding protein
VDGRPGVDQLRAGELFRHLPEAGLAQLAAALAVREVPAGAVVYEEGSPGDALFLLTAGDVHIDKRVETGGRVELARLAPGDVFGDLALIDRVPRAARAVAHTDATILVLDHESLGRWLRSDAPTAVGFFVELLRLLSRRLRRSYGQVILLSELSQLALQPFEGEAEFVQAALDVLIPHLEGDWSVAVFLRDPFDEPTERVGTAGPHPESLPETAPAGEAEHRWLDDATFCVALTGASPVAVGSLVARCHAALAPREKAEAEVALAAAGRLLASALLNIRHDTEERLRARLEQARDATG